MSDTKHCKTCTCEELKLEDLDNDLFSACQVSQRTGCPVNLTMDQRSVMVDLLYRLGWEKVRNEQS